MMYAKFINKDEIEYLPKNAVLGTESFSNARLLPKEKLNSFGYYEVKRADQPQYDYNTEFLRENYTLEDDVIKVDYTVEELFI